MACISHLLILGTCNQDIGELTTGKVSEVNKTNWHDSRVWTKRGSSWWYHLAGWTLLLRSGKVYIFWNSETKKNWNLRWENDSTQEFCKLVILGLAGSHLSHRDLKPNWSFASISEFEVSAWPSVGTASSFKSSLCSTCRGGPAVHVNEEVKLNRKKEKFDESLTQLWGSAGWQSRRLRYRT